jgi:phosphoribosylaminoimidazole carboxylase PurE protein
MAKEPQVAVVMGSDSDWLTMEQCVLQLKELGVRFEVEIMSAHRTPQRVYDYARGAEERGLKVIIAAAGLSAALAGAIAANTALPVIGVPVASGPLVGVDALLSTVQMPPGVPVATMGIGPFGARNAAVLAVEILALGDPALVGPLKDYRRKQAETVDSKNLKLRELLGNA